LIGGLSTVGYVTTSVVSLLSHYTSCPHLAFWLITKLKCAIIQLKNNDTKDYSEQLEFLNSQPYFMRPKNCYPVVRFSGTPYRLVPSQKKHWSYVCIRDVVTHKPSAGLYWKWSWRWVGDSLTLGYRCVVSQNSRVFPSEYNY